MYSGPPPSLSGLPDTYTEDLPRDPSTRTVHHQHTANTSGTPPGLQRASLKEVSASPAPSVFPVLTLCVRHVVVQFLCLDCFHTESKEFSAVPWDEFM